jgi:hypothetical protein
MKSILNPIQIGKSCVKITCGADQGTAYFVSKNLLVTAFHVIMDGIEIGEEIFISASAGQLKCSVVANDKDLDISLLSVDTDNEVYLPLLSSVIKVNEKCETYGYPYKGQSDDISLSGKINQVLINSKCDFVISDINIDKNYDYEGLSGAPIVVNGKVIGVVLRQMDDRIGAISIGKVKEFLVSHELEIEEEYNYFEVPKQFIEDVRSSTPNYSVFENIDNTIKQNKNWFLLKGSPGSGKSTISASFKPENEKMVVCGRYFVKVPNDTEPIFVRSSMSFFLDTLENLINITVTGFPCPKDELKIEERIKRLVLSLNELSSYYQKNDEIGLIILDGLDEVNNLEEFLGILPLNLPNNLKFLLSCTSIDILPSAIKSIIEPEQIVNVTPIDLGQCEAFIIKNLGAVKLPINIVQELATKSEGHALYLRYLVNFIKTQTFDEEKNELEDWVRSIPSIEGDISKYYNSIWDKISSASEKLWITIILAHLRQGVLVEELYNMLPSHYQLSFYTYFPSIKYLLNDKQKIEIYHNSFKEYILLKTKLNEKTANDFISTYCENNKESKFAISNALYHYSLSSHPEKSIIYCDQSWADKCALEDVLPDLVINDAKRIVNIAIDLNKTTDVIRLLLLLHRIEFRYDNVFNDNADLIAQALVSFGKYNSALKYIVRDGALLVSNHDALLFLQTFYENNATEEAEVLLSAIKSRYRKLLDEGVNSKEGLNLDVFTLNLNSIVLSMNEDPNGGVSQWMYFQDKLKSFQDKMNEVGENETSDRLYMVREYSAAWQMAYLIRRFNRFIDSKTTSEKTGIKLDNKWAKLRSLSLIMFNEFNNYNTVIVPKSENYFHLVNDVEYLIKNCGYEIGHDEFDILIRALINDSKEYTLISELINKYLPLISTISLKKPNGVDLNYRDVHKLLFEFKTRGYINDGGLPDIKGQMSRHLNWEEYVLSILRRLGYIEGRLYRFKAEDTKEGVELALNNLKVLISSLNFSLDERSYWEKAYHIPEHLFPLIYSKIAELLCEFNIPEIEPFLQTLQKKSKDQMGLYSEGFRSSIYEVSKVLIKARYDSKSISKIVNIWKEHTMMGLQNRWERTPELLKIVEIYSLNNDADQANYVFAEMLKTSMGPGWYKESQLDLLNTTLDLKVVDDSTDKYLQEFAGLLDWASGEMTFQRYVRYEKESFIACLINQSRLSAALKYFKNEIIPNPNVLIENAEANIIDAPRQGDGYCLGARNITEESGILKILSNVEFESVYLKWAFCEIFVINDDIFRYANDFASLQGKLLNQAESANSPFLEEMLQTIAETCSNEEMKKELREYLNNMGEVLTETNRNKLKLHLKKVNVEWNLERLDNTKIETSKEIKRDDKFDIFNKSYVKSSVGNPNKQILEGLNAFKDERVSIWFSNWSKSSGETKEILKSLFTNDIVTLTMLKESINKYDNETWIIVERLLWFLEKNLSPLQIKEIYNLISEHFTLLIKPEQRAFDKYDWLVTEDIKDNNDSQLAKFLIWFLNHPVKRIRERATKSIQKLCVYDPTLIIPLLLEECLSEKPDISPEKCSQILVSLSESHSNLIIKVLSEDSSYLEKLKNLKHFSIRKHFRDIGLNLDKQGFKDLFEVMNNSFPDSVALSGEVVLDEAFLNDIDYQIQELNEMLLLDRAFCETILNSTKELCKPLNVSDFQKSDKYLLRSFYEDSYKEGRFNHILRFALNIAISPRVSSKDIDKVYEILNY